MGVIYTRRYVLGWSFALNGLAPPLDTSSLPALPWFGPKPRSKVLEITLLIATTAFVLVVVIAVFLFVRTRVRCAEVREDWEVEFGPRRFSYKELYQATKGFRNKKLLSTGGFGWVYKGVLPKSNLEIAVKKVSHDSKQGMKEFVAEVVSIGHLRHQNLMQLLGYCRRNGKLVLDWGRRIQIIKTRSPSACSFRRSPAGAARLAASRPTTRTCCWTGCRSTSASTRPSTRWCCPCRRWR